MEKENLKEIYLAGGCFWGTEHYFKQIDGVVDTEVGFANGRTENPTYKEVCTDKTGFVETVHVTYDPAKVSLKFLLEMYFKAIGPTSINRQGHDAGTQYRTGVYYTDKDDEKIINEVFAEEQKHINGKIAVENLPLQNFYKADPLIYHQLYHRSTHRDNRIRPQKCHGSQIPLSHRARPSALSFGGSSTQWRGFRVYRAHTLLTSVPLSWITDAIYETSREGERKRGVRRIY